MKRFCQRLIPAGGLPVLLATAAKFMGTIFLALAAFLPWFLVPEFVPSDTALDGTVRGIEPGVTWFLRAACLAVVATLAAVRWIWKMPRRHTIRIAGALLAAVLLYPTCILYSSPNLAARAAWLWSQHDQLTGYSGDIYTSQEVRDATWQQRILVVNEPLDDRILTLPTWDPANPEWGRLLEITEWFGLSPWFVQALGRGWVLALAGTALLLLALLRERAREEPQSLRHLMRRSLAITTVVVALVMIPFLASAHFLTRARAKIRSGDSTSALADLDRAAAVLPAIREDGVFFLQVGRLESELGLATPAAEFFQSQRMAEDGYAQQAQTAMLGALPTAGPGTVWRRELVKGLLSRAINMLNSGQTDRAFTVLEKILEADPCNLKANYTLQIACVRAARLEELRLLATRMQQTCRFINTPTKRSVLASSQENLAASELLSGAAAPALAHWRLSKKPAQ